MVRSVEYAGIHIRRVLFGMGGGGTAWSRGGRTVSCVRIKETFRKFMVCIYINIYTHAHYIYICMLTSFSSLSTLAWLR